MGERYTDETAADDLHSRLVAAITARLDAARAATPGSWIVQPYAYGPPEDGWGPPIPEVYAPSGAVVSHQPHEGGGISHEPDAAHIALHDPTDAILRYERDLKVLERHAPQPLTPFEGMEPLCTACPGPWRACQEIRDLFDAYPEVERVVRGDT